MKAFLVNYLFINICLISSLTIFEKGYLRFITTELMFYKALKKFKYDLLLEVETFF